MPRVFVPQEAPGRNISGATKFGEIVILLPPGDISQVIPTTTEYLLKRMYDLTSEDYIMMMGSPRLLIDIGLVAFVLTRGNFQVLNWDRQNGIYFPTTFDTRDLIKIINKGDTNDNNQTDRHVPGPAKK